MKQQRRRAARAECVIRKAAFTRATFLQRDSTIFYA